MTTSTAPLVIFTPSAMSPEVLEAIFVQRENLARRIVSSIKESATTAAKHHWLLVGQRGMGKTHLVALVYHRLQKQRGLAKHLRIAWLREETWEVSSYLDLLEVILAAIAQELSGREASSLKERIDELLDLRGTKAERAAEALILEAVGDRTLLLLVENLDEVFKGIQLSGQRALRAFIETTDRFSILATTPALFAGVSTHNNPFYGFFNVEHLEELSFDEARELLCRVAKLRNDPKLLEFLQGPVGEARLRVVAELAGGHPRIWILFATCLSIELIDELVPLFIKMLDDLTPYYQERMRSLSAQQRRIVTHLADFGGAQPVKDIARACRIEQRSAAKVIGDLEAKGFLRKAPELDVPTTGDRRLALYELREPLMRLCLDVKESRGKPLRLIVEFLREWYGFDLFSLSKQVEANTLAAAYIEEAIMSFFALRTKEEIESLLEQSIEMFVFALLILTLSSKAEEITAASEELLTHLQSVRLSGTTGTAPLYQAWANATADTAARDNWIVRLATQLTYTAGLIANRDAFAQLRRNVAPDLDHELLTEEDIRTQMAKWVRLWGEVIGHDELEPAKAILAAALEWRMSGDRGALMALPKEERQILRQMINAKVSDAGDLRDEGHQRS